MIARISDARGLFVGEIDAEHVRRDVRRLHTPLRPIRDEDAERDLRLVRGREAHPPRVERPVRDGLRERARLPRDADVGEVLKNLPEQAEESSWKKKVKWL